MAVAGDTAGIDIGFTAAIHPGERRLRYRLSKAEIEQRIPPLSTIKRAFASALK